MARRELIFGGFGGQGIILSGYIIGKAASIYDNKNATLTQSYGPEARGGACSANVVISDIEQDYPGVTKPHILTVMSQEAFNTYFPKLREDGLLLYDNDLVGISNIPASMKVYSIPATRLAEKLGKKIIANIVMLGFFTVVTGEVSYEAMKDGILSSVPKGTEELNLKAFESGYTYGKDCVDPGTKH